MRGGSPKDLTLLNPYRAYLLAVLCPRYPFNTACIHFALIYTDVVLCLTGQAYRLHFTAGHLISLARGELTHSEILWKSRGVCGDHDVGCRVFRLYCSRTELLRESIRYKLLRGTDVSCDCKTDTRSSGGGGRRGDSWHATCCVDVEPPIHVGYPHSWQVSSYLYQSKPALNHTSNILIFYSY